MKESLQRIVTWAKAHPYYAAAILGVLILLVYLTIKRGGGGGGFSGGGVEASDMPDDSGGVSADIGSGSFANLGSPGNDVVEEDTPPAPIGAGGGGNGGDRSSDQANDYQMTAPSDYVVPPSSYAMAQGAPISSQGMNSLTLQASAAGGVKGKEPQAQKKTVQASATSGTKGSTPKVEKPIQGTATSGTKGSTPKVEKPIQGTATSGTKTATPQTAKPIQAKTTKAMTPKPTMKTHAELVGLPRYYNGYYGGYIYVLGMRTFSTPAGSGTKSGTVKRR